MYFFSCFKKINLNVVYLLFKRESLKNVHKRHISLFIHKVISVKREREREWVCVMERDKESK